MKAYLFGKAQRSNHEGNLFSGERWGTALALNGPEFPFFLLLLFFTLYKFMHTDFEIGCHVVIYKLFLANTPAGAVIGSGRTGMQERSEMQVRCKGEAAQPLVPGSGCVRTLNDMLVNSLNNSLCF